MLAKIASVARPAASATARRAFSTGLSFELDETQRELQATARKFAQEVIAPVAAEYDLSGEWPREVFKQAWELGLCNSHVPEMAGGMGLGCLEGVVLAEELAWGCSGIATAIEANGLASAPVIVAGSDAQKKEFLGRLTEEPLAAAYCVTEPGAGSDVAGLRTRAEKKGNEWVINGSKMWITNGGVANWYFLVARTGDTGSAGKDFTAFVLNADTPGITVGAKEINMGQRASDTRGITFEDVVIPDANVLGKVGSGFIYAMNAFDITRPAVAAGAVGVARRAMEEARDYALQRTTMGKKIAQHQGVAFKFADMATGIEASRLLTYKAAWLKDNGRPNTTLASMAKLMASEQCAAAVDQGLQVFGGSGFSESGPLAKLYRDARIYRLYEGTSEIQRLLVSRAPLSHAPEMLP